MQAVSLVSNAADRRFRAWAVGIAWALLLLLAPAAHASSSVVRVGVLKFGTLNWELDVMRRHGFDRAHGFSLETVELAGKDGAAVALQGGAVDIILTDWLWVAQRRATGGDFTFAPHSHATGGVVVRRGGAVASVADLRAKRFGVGGGPLDKSWLILRAYGKKMFGLDLAREAQPVFAAPPLLNEILKRGELPAAVNFWQYNARLPVNDFTELISVEMLLKALGLPADMPLLGFVFSRRWSEADPHLVGNFLAAARESRDVLARDPAEWQAIAALLHADNPGMLERLRQAYRGGFGEGLEQPADAAQRLVAVLQQFGEFYEALPGGRIPDGTFFHDSSS